MDDTINLKRRTVLLIAQVFAYFVIEAGKFGFQVLLFSALPMMHCQTCLSLSFSFSSSKPLPCIVSELYCTFIMSSDGVLG